MQRNEFERNWEKIKREIKNKWNKLTDQDINSIHGDYFRFIDTLQKKQGLSKEQAEREIQNWRLESNNREQSRLGQNEESAGRGEYGNREKGSRGTEEGSMKSLDRNEGQTKPQRDVRQERREHKPNTEKEKKLGGKEPKFGEEHKNKEDKTHKQKKDWEEEGKEKRRKAG